MSSVAAAKLLLEQAQRRYQEAIARENEATITSESDLLSRQIDSWRLLSDPSVAPSFAAGHSRLPSDLNDYYFDPGLAGFDEHNSPSLVPFDMDGLPVETFDLASWSFKSSASAAPITATANLATASTNVTAEDLSRLLNELDTDSNLDSRLSHPSSLMESFSLDSHTTSELSASPRSFWSPPLHTLDTAPSWTDSFPAKASSTYSMDSASSVADDFCEEDRNFFDLYPTTVGSTGGSRHASLRRANYRASPYPTSPALRATVTSDEVVSARLSALNMTSTTTSIAPITDEYPFSLDGGMLFTPSDFALPPTLETSSLSKSLPIDIPTASNSAAFKATTSRRPSKGSADRRPSSVPKTRSPPKFSYDSSLEFPKNETHRFIVFTQAKAQSDVNEHSVTELYLDPNTPEDRPLYRMVFKSDLTASTESDLGDYTFFGEDGSLWTVTYSPSFGPVIVPSVAHPTPAPRPIFTFIHFAPHTFVMSPSPIGSLPWWRVQACEVKHDLFPGEGYWTARYDAVVNSRRPARIIAHFSSCRHRRSDGDAFVLGKFARAVQATL